MDPSIIQQLEERVQEMKEELRQEISRELEENAKENTEALNSRISSNRKEIESLKKQAKKDACVMGPLHVYTIAREVLYYFSGDHRSVLGQPTIPESGGRFELVATGKKEPLLKPRLHAVVADVYGASRRHATEQEVLEFWRKADMVLAQRNENVHCIDLSVLENRVGWARELADKHKYLREQLCNAYLILDNYNHFSRHFETTGASTSAARPTVDRLDGHSRKRTRY